MTFQYKSNVMDMAGFLQRIPRERPDISYGLILKVLERWVRQSESR